MTPLNDWFRPEPFVPVVPPDTPSPHLQGPAREAASALRPDPVDSLTKVPRFLGQFRNCPQPTPRMEGLLGLAPQFAYCFERA